MTVLAESPSATESVKVGELPSSTHGPATTSEQGFAEEDMNMYPEHRLASSGVSDAGGAINGILASVAENTPGAGTSSLSNSAERGGSDIVEGKELVRTGQAGLPLLQRINPVTGVGHHASAAEGLETRATSLDSPRLGAWGPTSPNGLSGRPMPMLNADMFLPAGVGPVHSILPQNSMSSADLMLHCPEAALESDYMAATSGIAGSNPSSSYSFMPYSNYSGYGTYESYPGYEAYGEYGGYSEENLPLGVVLAGVGVGVGQVPAEGGEEDYDEADQQAKAMHAHALLQQAAELRAKATAAAANAAVKASAAVAASARAADAVARASALTGSVASCQETSSPPASLEFAPNANELQGDVSGDSAGGVLEEGEEEEEQEGTRTGYNCEGDDDSEIELSEEEENEEEDDEEEEDEDEEEEEDEGEEDEAVRPYTGLSELVKAELLFEEVESVPASEDQASARLSTGPFPFQVPKCGRARTQKRPSASVAGVRQAAPPERAVEDRSEASSLPALDTGDSGANDATLVTDAPGMSPEPLSTEGGPSTELLPSPALSSKEAFEVVETKLEGTFPVEIRPGIGEEASRAGPSLEEATAAESGLDAEAAHPLGSIMESTPVSGMAATQPVVDLGGKDESINEKSSGPPEVAVVQDAVPELPAGAPSGSGMQGPASLAADFVVPVGDSAVKKEDLQNKRFERSRKVEPDSARAGPSTPRRKEDALGRELQGDDSGRKAQEKGKDQETGEVERRARLLQGKQDEEGNAEPAELHDKRLSEASDEILDVGAQKEQLGLSIKKHEQGSSRMQGRGVTKDGGITAEDQKIQIVVRHNGNAEEEDGLLPISAELGNMQSRQADKSRRSGEGPERGVTGMETSKGELETSVEEVMADLENPGEGMEKVQSAGEEVNRSEDVPQKENTQGNDVLKQRSDPGGKGAELSVNDLGMKREEATGKAREVVVAGEAVVLAGSSSASFTQVTGATEPAAGAEAEAALRALEGTGAPGADEASAPPVASSSDRGTSSQLHPVHECTEVVVRPSPDIAADMLDVAVRQTRGQSDVHRCNCPQDVEPGQTIAEPAGQHRPATSPSSGPMSSPKARPRGPSANTGLGLGVGGNEAQGELGPRPRKRPRHLMEDDTEEEVTAGGRRAMARTRAAGMLGRGQGPGAEPEPDLPSEGWAGAKRRTPVARRPARLTGTDPDAGENKLQLQSGIADTGGQVNEVFKTQIDRQFPLEQELHEGAGERLAGHLGGETRSRDGDVAEGKEVVVGGSEYVNRLKLDGNREKYIEQDSGSIPGSQTGKGTDITEADSIVASGNAQKVDDAGGSNIAESGNGETAKPGKQMAEANLKEKVVGRDTRQHDTQVDKVWLTEKDRNKVVQEQAGGETDEVGNGEAASRKSSLEAESKGKMLKDKIEKPPVDENGKAKAHGLAISLKALDGDEAGKSFLAEHEGNAQLIFKEEGRLKGQQAVPEREEGPGGGGCPGSVARAVEDAEGFGGAETRKLADMGERGGPKVVQNELEAERRGKGDKEDGTSDLEHESEEEGRAAKEGQQQTAVVGFEKAELGFAERQGRMPTGRHSEDEGIVVDAEAEIEGTLRSDDEKLGPGEVVSEGKFVRSPSSRQRKRPRHLLDHEVELDTLDLRPKRVTRGDRHTGLGRWSDGEGEAVGRVSRRAGKLFGSGESSLRKFRDSTYKGESSFTGTGKCLRSQPEDSRSRRRGAHSGWGSSDAEEEEGVRRVTRADTALRRLDSGAERVSRKGIQKEEEGEVPEEERCSKTSGQGWRCKARAEPGRKTCTYHLKSHHLPSAICTPETV